jgi:hypothetical protein
LVRRVDPGVLLSFGLYGVAAGASGALIATLAHAGLAGAHDAVRMGLLIGGCGLAALAVNSPSRPGRRPGMPPRPRKP